MPKMFLTFLVSLNVVSGPLRAEGTSAEQKVDPPKVQSSGSAVSNPALNPLLQGWKTPFGTPPFPSFREEHYLPAFKEAMARQKREVEAILKNPGAPDFKNTVLALEESGGQLEQVSGVFFSLLASETTPKLQEIAQAVSPLLSSHSDDINLNEKLFLRVKAVHDRQAQEMLGPLEARLLDLTYKNFVRSGALLTESGKRRMRAINEELSLASLKFDDNVLKETNAFKLVVDRREDLAGLPEGAVEAAAGAAKQAGLQGKWLFTLHQPSVVPVLKYARNRELRKQLWTASNSRCDHGDGTDNKRLAVKIAELRLERSRLLGFPSYADFVLDDRMAKTPAQVNALLDRVRVPALAAAKREAAELQSLIDAEGGGFKLEPWDWYYYAEKVKKAKYDLDAEALSVYFSLDRVLEGAMQVAGKLYGVTFSPRKDIPAYHPEVRVFEVKEGDGRHIGLLYADFHPRPGKRGGGWTGGFRSFRILGGTPVTPLVTNVCNFSRATAGKPSLLNPMEVETLFHEFGHALHSLFDQSPYQSLGSGGVSWDFVEVPSQIFENWLGEAQVVKSFARRYDTGEPIPDEALEKIRKARRFNQGFETLGYLAPCYLDLEWHALKEAKDLDATQFEKRVLERMGMPREVSPYHRTPYFRHVFAGGYAAGYYSYLWSEVLDADAFQAFKEKGDVFHPATAKSFRENILSKGNTEDAMDLYLRFRGAKPGVEPMLKKRGLMD